MNATVRGIAALLMLSACSLDEGGGAGPGADASPPDAPTDTTSQDVTPPPPDAPADAPADASVDAPADATVDAPADAPADAPSDAGDAGTCTASGACTQALPAGWSPMAVPTNPSTACPSGFNGTDLLGQVTANAGACGCGCNVTKNPVCNVGSIQRYISNDASCSTLGVLVTVNGGGCTALGQTGQVANHAKGNPIAPSGGTCGASVVEDKTKVTKTLVRTCNGVSCAENVCNGDVPLGFSACVVKTGDQPTCPAGFTAQRTVVGGDFTLGCSSCACDVNGASTCSGATLAYYSDNQCNNLVTSGPVDGVCNANQNVGNNVSQFKYSATVNAACTASGSKTSTPALTVPTTVCCK